MERKSSLYRTLLGMVSGESRAGRGNILRKVPVTLFRMACKCFIKSSLDSKVSLLHFAYEFHNLKILLKIMIFILLNLEWYFNSSAPADIVL